VLELNVRVVVIQAPGIVESMFGNIVEERVSAMECEKGKIIS
jgi:hypothetical protein